MEKKAVLEQKGIFQDIIMKKTRNLEKGEYDDYVDQYK
jgi:hypothetical protein